jgi:hypothetical protein
MTDNAQRAPCTVPPIVGSGPFSVSVKIHGDPRGEYRFQTEAEAVANAEDKRKRFGVLGFTYRVAPNIGICINPPSKADA